MRSTRPTPHASTTTKEKALKHDSPHRHLLPALLSSVLVLQGACQLDQSDSQRLVLPHDDDEALSLQATAPEQDVHEHGFASHLLVEHGEPSPTTHLAGQESFLLSDLAHPVQQLGFLLSASSSEEEDAAVRWRARGLDGIWTSWQDAEITWTEGRLMVGRAVMARPADEIEVRLTPGAFAHARVELFDDLRARAQTLTRDLPHERRLTPSGEENEALLTRSQAVAPANLVIPRADWGARDPSRICGNVVKPYRVSVHHTAQPDNDGDDPAARMRQMQAYHIDTNGWCDIGYHFVVSQSGKIYQGRSDERRPGAHVGGQNAGNIGVSFIGNYQTSQPPQLQLDAGKKILDWIRTTYAIEWNRANVKGHREWPGQTTSCPGDNLLARLSDLMDAEPGTPVDPPRTEIEIEANWLMHDALEDRLTQGSSAGILDALPGATFQAELLLSNKSEHPIRGVKLGYLIEHPYLQATSYTIQTDAPHFDRATWMTNDADEAEENPDKDALGQAGELTMYAFAAGETKRVLLDVEASRYSLGQIDHPDVRVWASHIDDIYEGQSSWNVQPTIDTTGRSDLLQAHAQLDIPSPVQWQFDAGEEEMLEGWTPCPETSTPRIDIERGALLLDAHRACLTSPAWTDIDASRYDEIVLRLSESDAPTTLVITYATERDALTGSAPFYVELPAQATARTLVLSMAEQPTWGGRIAALQIETLAAEPSPGATIAIDALFFQSSEQQSTSAEIEEHVALPYTPISTTPPDHAEQEQDPDPNPGEQPGQGGDPPNGQPMAPDPQDESSSDDDRVKDGCTTSASQPSQNGSSLVALLLALAALIGARRPRSRS